MQWRKLFELMWLLKSISVDCESSRTKIYFKKYFRIPWQYLMTLAFAFNIMCYIPHQNPTKAQLFILFQLNKLYNGLND